MNSEYRAFCQINKVIFLLLEPASLKNISQVFSWQAKLSQNWITVSQIIKPKKILGTIDYHKPNLAVIVGIREQTTGQISLRDCSAKKAFLVKEKELINWVNNYAKNGV